MQTGTDSTPVSLRDRLKHMRRGSAALDAILTAPGAHARSPDVTLEAPNALLEDFSSALDNRLLSTPLYLEDVAVVLENDSSAPSGRRASLNPAQGLAMPSYRSMKVSDEAAHLSDARLAAPHSVARRSSVSSMPFSAPSTLGSVPHRRASVALGIGRSGHSSVLSLGSQSNLLASDSSVEQQEHMRIEQLEKRLSEVLQREASLNVYLSDVISRQDHESAVAEAATAHALKMGEAAVSAEQQQQAHAKEMSVTLSAHCAEIERARKMHSSETDLLKDQVQVLVESVNSLRLDIEEVTVQRDLLAGDNERQSNMLHDLQLQVKELAEAEAQASIENAAIQKQSTHALQRMRSNLDEETRLRQSFHDQLSVSTSANAVSQRQLEELKLSLKESEDKRLNLQADLAEALDLNTTFQANIAASALKISELDSELLNLRVAVAEKLPLADRVLQLEKDAKASIMSMQEAQTAHEETISQIASLTAEKMALLQSLQTVQADAEDRYNRTFKTKEEYISQVEAAESALEQTRQQLLQLQMTCNDMRSRIDEAKQNEPQHIATIRENARKHVLEELSLQMKAAVAVAVCSFDHSCTACLASVDVKLNSFGKRIATCQGKVATGAKVLSFARASAVSTQSNHEKALSSLSGKLNEALLTITSFPEKLRLEQEHSALLRIQVTNLESDLAECNSKIEIARSSSTKERLRLLWKKFCIFLSERNCAAQQITLINHIMQTIHKAIGGVRAGHPLTEIVSPSHSNTVLSGAHKSRASLDVNPFSSSSDVFSMSVSRNYIVLLTAAHASAIARHMVAAFSGNASASSSFLFSSLASPGSSRGSALAAETISASRLPELSAALDDALAREQETNLKHAASRVQLEESLETIAELEQKLDSEAMRLETIQTESECLSSRLQDALARADEAEAVAADQQITLSSTRSSNNLLSLALDELRLKYDDQTKASEHLQKLLLQSGEDSQRHRDLMILGAQALTASKVDRLELGYKLQENQSEIARLESVLQNERQKVVLLQVSQSHQKAKRNTLLGSVQDLTSRVSEQMGQMQDQHTIFERKLREERRLRSSQEIRFVEDTAALQSNLNDALQQLSAVKTEALHAAERLAVSRAFIERAHKVHISVQPGVDVAVQTVSHAPAVSFGIVADNPLFDLSCIATLPKTPQSPAGGEISRPLDSITVSAHQRASVSPGISSMRDGINSAADLQEAFKALAKAEEVASMYRKELIEVTSQSAKDAHQFRLDIMNALVLAMDLTEIRGILKGSYGITRITPKGLTGPTGVSEERARRGQALLDEIETGVVSKSHELVEWASEYEAELETKVAILIARKKLREKLNAIVGQMGAMRSTQIAGQRNDLLKALKRIEREVQAVTTGDMAIVSNLSGSDFTLRDNSWVRTDRAFLLCNKIWMSRTLDAVDSLISRVAASSTMPFASVKSGRYVPAGQNR